MLEGRVPVSSRGADALQLETGTGNWKLLHRLEIRLRLRRADQPEPAQHLAAHLRVLLLLGDTNQPVVILRQEQSSNDRQPGLLGSAREQRSQLLTTADAAQGDDRRVAKTIVVLGLDDEKIGR